MDDFLVKGEFGASFNCYNSEIKPDIESKLITNSSEEVTVDGQLTKKITNSNGAEILVGPLNPKVGNITCILVYIKTDTTKDNSVLNEILQTFKFTN